MLKHQIRVSGLYCARVSGKLTTVRVDSISEHEGTHVSSYSGMRNRKATTSYGVTNLATGRKTVFRSAAKFRYEKKAGAYHHPSAAHPATCPGCTLDEVKYGQAVGGVKDTDGYQMLNEADKATFHRITGLTTGPNGGLS